MTQKTSLLAIVAIATMTAATMTAPASAGGLSLGGILTGKSVGIANGIGNGTVVVAPSVGDVAVGYGNDIPVLSGNSILNGSLNGILSGNDTDLGLDLFGKGGKKSRY